ncbi:MAG: LysR family transcriptional regulator [Methylophilus sp.]|uniref:LysR family transcriptional regulator n=1 Tax=Methylophilus sp. TaxID=29541 RepID=UPI003FA05F90
MITLNDLQVFVTVCEYQGFSAASKVLEISPAVASLALKRLEQHLDTQLLVRSTRHVALTEAGQRYLPFAKATLDTMREGQQVLHQEQREISGRMTISAPSDLGRGILRKLIDQFQHQHPKLEIKLLVSDKVTHLYQSTVDMAIRYGVPDDSNLFATSLMPANQRVICASPEYWELHGVPAHPEELLNHACLCFMLESAVHNQWRFEHHGNVIHVKVSGSKVTNDGEIVRQWALAGYGIAYKSRLDVAEDLQAGRLVAALTDYEAERAPLNAMTTQKPGQLPNVKLLIQFIKQELAAKGHAVKT